MSLLLCVCICVCVCLCVRVCVCACVFVCGVRVLCCMVMWSVCAAWHVLLFDELCAYLFVGCVLVCSVVAWLRACVVRCVCFVRCLLSVFTRWCVCFRACAVGCVGECASLLVLLCM